IPPAPLHIFASRNQRGHVALDAAHGDERPFAAPTVNHALPFERGQGAADGGAAHVIFFQQFVFRRERVSAGRAVLFNLGAQRLGELQIIGDGTAFVDERRHGERTPAQGLVRLYGQVLYNTRWVVGQDGNLSSA